MKKLLSSIVLLLLVVVVIIGVGAIPGCSKIDISFIEKYLNDEATQEIRDAEKALNAAHTYSESIGQNYTRVEQHARSVNEKLALFTVQKNETEKELQFIQSKTSQNLPIRDIGGNVLASAEIDQAVEIRGIRIQALRDAIATCKAEQKNLNELAAQLKADVAAAPIRIAELQASYDNLVMVYQMQKDRLELVKKMGGAVDLNAIYEDCKGKIRLAAGRYKKSEGLNMPKIDFEEKATSVVNASEARLQKIELILSGKKTATATTTAKTSIKFE